MDLNRDRVSRSTARLESVQNSQEFQAAQKEIEQLKKQKESLDEQTKKSQPDVKWSTRILADLAGQLAKFQEERDAQAQHFRVRPARWTRRSVSSCKSVAKHTPRVEARLLSQYDRVRGARAGLGIVPAIAGRCKGCNMMVPPQQFNEIQRGSTLHACPSCHRIFFVPSAGGSDSPRSEAWGWLGVKARVSH